MSLGLQNVLWLNKSVIGSGDVFACLVHVYRKCPSQLVYAYGSFQLLLEKLVIGLHYEFTKAGLRMSISLSMLCQYGGTTKDLIPPPHFFSTLWVVVL